MIAYWCGFNGFNQIADESTSSITSSLFKRVPISDIKCIDFSWSCAVVLSGEDVYVSGFCGNHSIYLKKLTKPESNLEFLKVACSEKYALFTAGDGECWQYFYNSEKWKKLPKFTIVERETDSNSECLKSSSKILESDVQNDKNETIIIKICCGEVVNIALDSNGQAYSIPSPIVMPGIKITEVVSGFEHCLLLDDLGRVYSTGSGMRGQLGCEVLETVDSPQEIKALGGLQVMHIAAGGWHSAAVTAGGVLYTWGWNNSGQLGFPCAESPESVSSLDQDHEETEIYDPEDNKGNEKENKDGCMNIVLESKRRKLMEHSEDVPNKQKEYITVLAVPKPVDFPSGTEVDVVAVSCGNRHTVVLADDGTAWGCGWNGYGQLGKSPDILSSVDTMIKLDVAVGEKISGVHCGGWNTVVFLNK